MKIQSTNFLVNLNNREINNLAEQVKETIATNVDTTNLKSSFTAVNLWNIQRMRKSRLLRRSII